MAEFIQFDFFKDPEISRLEHEIAETKKSLDRVRKGTYARINKAQKLADELEDRLEIVERNICRCVCGK